MGRGRNNREGKKELKKWIVVGLIVTSCVSIETTTYYNRGRVVRPHPHRPLFDITPQGKRFYIQVITKQGFDTLSVWGDEDWLEGQIVKWK